MNIRYTPVIPIAIAGGLLIPVLWLERHRTHFTPPLKMVVFPSESPVDEERSRFPEIRRDSRIALPGFYDPWIRRKQWDSLLFHLQKDTNLSEYTRAYWTAYVLFRKQHYDSALHLLRMWLPSAPHCLLYLEVLKTKLSSLPDTIIPRVYACADSLYPDQRGLLHLASLMIQSYFPDVARMVLQKMKPVVTTRYRARWNFLMGKVARMQGVIRDALDYYQEAIRERPDWIAPRMEMVEILPGSREGLAKKRQLLREILRLHPGYAPAYYYLAMLEGRKRLYRFLELMDSARLYHSSLADVQGAFPSWIRLLIRNREYAQARRLLLEWRRVDSTAPLLYFLLGELYRNQDSLSQARQAYLRALKLARFHYPEAWLHLGIVYRRSQMPDSAIWAYRNALRLRPDYHEALYNLALAWYHTGQIDSAYVLALRLIREFPPHDRTFYLLGRIYQKAGKMDSAISMYWKVLDIHPFHRKALLRLAELQPRNPELLPFLERYLDSIPEDFNIREKFARMLLRVRRDTPEAIRNLLRVVEDHPQDISARFRLARLFLARNEWEHARKWLREILDLKPASILAYRELVNLFLQQNQMDSVRKYWIALHRIAMHREFQGTRDDGELAYFLGRIAYRLDSFHHARFWFLRAYRWGYRPKWAAYRTGRACHRLDSLSCAIQYYRIALAQDSTFALAWKYLLPAYLQLGRKDSARIAWEKLKRYRPDDKFVEKFRKDVAENFQMP